MIAEDQIKPGIEIIEESNGMTRSARNGQIKTHYRVESQRSEYSWNVKIIECGRELSYYLSTGEIMRCYIKQ